MVQCIEAPLRLKTTRGLATDSTTHNDVVCNLDIDALNRRFATATPQAILAWCVQNIPQGLAQMTSFSLLAVTHMLSEELQQSIPVIFLDTLHLFPETLETAQRAKAHYDLDLHTYKVEGVSDRAAFARRYGDKLWERDIDRFYQLTKIEPLQRALADLNVQAWITGRRRDQSDARKDLPIFEKTDDGRVKINPLAAWTKKDIWAYIFEYGVLYNPLHDQGYSSIGDEPLTTPTLAGEDERAGRWRGSEKTECGIHF